MTLTLSERPKLREGAFGNATGLICRECGATSELGPNYACAECFGPLEISYDFGSVTREQIEAGPANIWRYKALLPVPADIESSPNLEPGFTRLLEAKNLAAELGLAKLWVNACWNCSAAWAIKSEEGCVTPSPSKLVGLV